MIKEKLPTVYQEFLALSRYARYDNEKKRREYWGETVSRYANFCRGILVSAKCPKDLTEKTINEIEDSVSGLSVMPSMRALMTAGPAAIRSPAAAYNCSYSTISGTGPIVELWDEKLGDMGYDEPIRIRLHNPIVFDEAFFILLNGTGFGFSVERQFIANLPTVGKTLSRSVYKKTGANFPRVPKEDLSSYDKRSNTIVVADSKEGWASALRIFIVEMYNGNFSVKIDVSGVRPAGAVLKTFGGRASGPEVLVEMLEGLRGIFSKADGRKLTSIECHDILCFISSAVVVGGVRRAALISLSNLSDERMRYAKSGEWWIENPQRRLANNSAAHTEKPEVGTFMREWISLYESKSGERGIFNRKAAIENAAKYGRILGNDVGLNPCLTGDTLVAVADGRGVVPIRQLAKEDKDVNVFCFDDKNRVAIRAMRNPRITGYNMPVFKITLDDGSEIRATENHKLLTKNDGYKEIKDLVVGDSLNIVTKFEASIKDIFPKENSNSQNYWWFTKGGSDKKSEHRLIAEYANCGLIQKGYVVHHKNFNAQDNSPENLQVMLKEDHDRLHGDLVRGANNPMVRAKTEWPEEKWASYRQNMSAAISGKLNGRYSGITNEQLREHAMKLTVLLGRRFSSKDWCTYAEKNGLPQHFSKWREDHLGGITGLAKSCALELGIDHIDVDPRIIESYKIVVDAGYDADIIDGLVVINKKCEVCGTPFQTTYSRRETGVCSQQCAGKKSGESLEVRSKRKETAKTTYDNRRETNRVLQSKIYSDLKFELGRDPQKKEWASECKKNGVTSEMCRGSSPFMTYGQLKEAASMYNHKIVSIEFDCYEDVYNGTVDEFHNFFIGGFEGKLENGKKKATFLNNLQCGEIFLRPNQFCNLSAAAARPDDTLEDLKEKVRIATIVGTIQATLTNFSYISSSWKENCEEERLLGVSIPGAMDHPVLQNVSDEARSWIDDLSQVVVDTNREWAKLLGINPAAASRCQKPAGNSGELYNVASGLHARFGPYYIRRVRADAKDPLAQVMKKQGFPCEEDTMQPGSWVFSFLAKAPAGAVFRDTRAAIEQLEYWLMWKKHWTDHNPSVTIYVKEHEWMEVGAWVWNHFDEVCGISFLPHFDHVYKQAPYEEITKEEYEKLLSVVPTYIDYEALKELETSDHTVSMQEPACSAGGCDVI